MNTFSQKVADKALTEKPWVTRNRDGSYKVVPRTLKDGKREHGKYKLTVAQEDHKQVVTSCVDYRTNTPCLGFEHSGYCYHSYALYFI